METKPKEQKFRRKSRVTSDDEFVAEQMPLPEEDKKIRRKRRRRRRSPRKIKNYEDNEYDELEQLVRTGIRNKKNTVQLFRILVRTTDFVSRMNLLNMMIQADAPCKRLFIDYQVLKILSGKVADLGFQMRDLDMKLTVQELLSRLPIPNRTVLVESKIWQIVARWAKANNEDEMAELEADDEKKEAIKSSLPSSASTSCPSSPVPSSSPKMEKIESELLDRVAAIAKSRDDQQSTPLPQPSLPPKEEPKKEISQLPSLPIKKEEEEFDQAVSETMSNLVAQISAQASKDEKPQNTAERVDEEIKPEVEPIVKAALKSTQEEEAEIETKIRLIQKRAEQLLEEWELLKEQFRIPKRMKSQLRAEHEREADQAAAEASLNGSEILSLPPSSSNSFFATPSTSWKQGGLTYSQYQQQHQKYHFPPVFKAENIRLSRFDDTSGLLHKKDLELSQTHRRNFIRGKREQDAKEKADFEQRVRAHSEKCKYLSLRPEMTPFFDEYPEFFFDFGPGEWVPMPPATQSFPPFKNNLPFPSMAVLPLEAFRPGDTVESNRKYYPPGVVADSKMFEAYYSNFASEEGDEEHPENSGSEDGETEKVPHLGSVAFLSSEMVNDQIPFLSDRNIRVPETQQSEFSDEKSLEAPSIEEEEDDITSSVDMNIIKLNRCGGSAKPDVVIRLPPNWNISRDAFGNIYYYNSKTRESQWEPPELDPSEEIVDDGEETFEMETASPHPINDDEKQQQDEDTDDEDEEEEDSAATTKAEENIEDLASDLSAQEKELLLTKKRRSREERRFERKKKRERDREKREYERKRRRERHGKHRRNGLVKEHLIPVRAKINHLAVEIIFDPLQRRSEKDKSSLMTFKEMRERLANRDAIREKQEEEERLEVEKEKEEERLKRQQDANEAAAITTPTTSTLPAATPPINNSAAMKKAQDKFMKETSKVIVRELDPYQKVGVSRGHIKCKEDFKHLAKKVKRPLHLPSKF